MNEYKYSFYSGLIRIVANVLMLGALILSVYMGHRQPDQIMSVFCSWLFSLLVPIWGGAWLAHKVLRRMYPAPEDKDVSVVPLPGKGATRVRWTVVHRPGADA